MYSIPKFTNQRDELIFALECYHLNANFDLIQLRNEYKRKSMKYHPDRPNGNKELFDFIKTQYNLLHQYYNSTHFTPRTYDEISNERDDFSQKQQHYLQKNKQSQSQSQSQSRNIPVQDNRFNLNRFNQIYNENRLNNVYDKGYESYFQQHQTHKETEKINSKHFDARFVEQKKKKQNTNNQLIIQPDSLYSMTSNTFTNLEDTDIQNFTGHTDQLHYVDIMDAYENNHFIDPDEISRRQDHKTYNEYMAYRDQQSKMTLPVNELHYMKEKDYREKISDELRQQNIFIQDQQITKHFQKVNQLMLNK